MDTYTINKTIAVITNTDGKIVVDTTKLGAKGVAVDGKIPTEIIVLEEKAPEIDNTDENGNKKPIDRSCRHTNCIYVDNGDGTHTKKCLDCGLTFKPEAHTGNPCSKCGLKYVAQVYLNTKESKYFKTLAEAIDFVNSVDISGISFNTNLVKPEKSTIQTNIFIINDCSENINLNGKIGLIVSDGVNYSGIVSGKEDLLITKYDNKPCKGYAPSIEKALDMFNVSKTEIGAIRLDKDFSFNETLNVYCGLALDMNGHNITSTANGWAIYVKGDGSNEHKESHAETITIKNSSTTESKVIKSTAGGIIIAGDGLIIDNNVMLEFSGNISEYGVIGIFNVNNNFDPISEIRSGVKIVVSSTAGNGNVIYNTAKLELKDGCVITDNRAKNDNNEVIYQQNSGTLTTVNGGSLTTNSIAFDGSEFVVNGGVITCDTIAQSNTIEVNDGTFYENAIVKVGGFIKSDCVINGGTFATDPSAYAKDGYKGEKGSDGRYSLVEKTAVEDGVASVNGETFETLAEALAYALKEDIGVIDLLADTEETILIDYYADNASYSYCIALCEDDYVTAIDYNYKGFKLFNDDSYALIINRNDFSCSITCNDEDDFTFDDSDSSKYVIYANVFNPGNKGTKYYSFSEAKKDTNWDSAKVSRNYYIEFSLNMSVFK